MKIINDSSLMELKSTQKGFIMSMRSLPPELTGNNLCELFAELFPPEKHFPQGEL